MQDVLSWLVMAVIAAVFAFNILFARYTVHRALDARRIHIVETNFVATPVIFWLLIAAESIVISCSIQQAFYAITNWTRGLVPRNDLELLNDWRSLCWQRKSFQAPRKNERDELVAILLRDVVFIIELVFALAALIYFYYERARDGVTAFFCITGLIYLVVTKLAFNVRAVLVHVVRGDVGRWSNPRAVAVALFNYLILICAFAGIYMWLSAFPGEFSGGCPNNSPLTAIYFSTITIMTIGYGDIAPTGELAKIAVIAEAWVGLFMAVVILAELVGRLGQGDQSVGRATRRPD